MKGGLALNQPFHCKETLMNTSEEQWWGCRSIFVQKRQ